MKETPKHYLLHIANMKEREVLFKAMKNNTAKKPNTLTSTIKDVLGEQNFMHETTNLRGKHLKSM